MDVIVERLLSNIMKVKTSLEQDFNEIDNQGTDEEQEEGTEENRVQPDTEVNPISTDTDVSPEPTGTELNPTGIAPDSYILLEGHKGIVFKGRDKLRIKRLGWLYGKRFRNM